jgi:hypothetical protein
VMIRNEQSRKRSVRVWGKENRFSAVSCERWQDIFFIQLLGSRVHWWCSKWTNPLIHDCIAFNSITVRCTLIMLKGQSVFSYISWTVKVLLLLILAFRVCSKPLSVTENNCQ